MADLLQNLVFDHISLWIGLIAGAIGLWLIIRLKPVLPGFLQGIRSRSKLSGASLLSNNAGRLQQEMLRYVQGLHLASTLFALDEVLVEPRLLIPPPPTIPGVEKPPGALLSSILPYLPDWPELAARYSGGTLSLAEALSGGANLLLTGSPGAGKTVALAHLACQVARKDQAVAHLHGFLPVYTHVSDLFPGEDFDRPPLQVIRDGVHLNAESFPVNRLENLLRQSLRSGKMLLLLDGLDEVNPQFHLGVTGFLGSLLENYPQTRLVVAATQENLSSLIKLGMKPVAMAIWNEKQHLAFINKWSRSWFRLIRPTLEDRSREIDPRLLNAWLLSDNPIISAFDATLKAWAVFAGDAVGPSYLDGLESYIRRMTSHREKSRQGLEDFALQVVAAQQTAMDLRHARGLDLGKVLVVGEDAEAKHLQKDLARRGQKSTKKLPGVLPDLIENGILVSRQGDRLSFSHPLVMAYLASAALANAPVSHFLSSQPDWSGKSLTQMFLAASREEFTEVSELLSGDDDLLLRGPLSVGRWLRYAPKTSPWRNKAMRSLSNHLQRSSLPLGLRARLLSALLLSNDPGVSVLLRQISHTSSQDLRLLSALGLGYQLDPHSLNRLSELLAEPESVVSQAACFALAKLGNQQSLELLGSALLNGSDGVRRAAAEAMALDEQEGHEMLKEASQMEDLLVRRSAVYGLAQVDQPWAEQVLNQLAMEDKEWMVRSAATQVIESQGLENESIPRVPAGLHEIPWLITFAGDRGIGIAPGQPAKNLLITALLEGSPEQQQAALETLQMYPDTGALPHIYELIESRFGVLQPAAFETLLSYAFQGIEIRRPAPSFN